MYTTRNLFWVSLIGSILIFLIGVELKINEKMSGGYLYSKSGDMSFGTINGTSVIFLSILVLIFSLWNYSKYKKVVKERNDAIKNEEIQDNKIFLKKIKSSSRSDLNLFLYNRKEFNKKYNLKK